MSKNIGKCHICQKVKELTFEHIPPNKALNNMPIKMYTGDSYTELLKCKKRHPWEFDGLQYVNSQKGFGLNTLCKECNNNTGSFYGEEYIKWVHSIFNYINSIGEDYKKASMITIKIYKVYPGRFIRQVLSFIASTDDTFIEKYPYVKDLLLNKDSNYADIPDFHIYMYLIREPYIDITGKSALVFKDGISIVNELNLYPFGFLVTYDNSKHYNMVEITNFIKCSYNDIASPVEMDLVILDKNISIPTNYKTKAELMKAIDN